MDVGTRFSFAALLICVGVGATVLTLTRCTADKKDEPMEYIEQPSGLKYRIVKHGTGDTTAKPGAKVRVHYTGWLDNGGEHGEEFDSSRNRGPFEFNVGAGRVIPGWDEAVLMMHPGAKWQVIIPPDLGYGPGGAGRKIPPNATLHFDIELLEILGS